MPVIASPVNPTAIRTGYHPEFAPRKVRPQSARMNPMTSTATKTIAKV